MFVFSRFIAVATALFVAGWFVPTQTRFALTQAT